MSMAQCSISMTNALEILQSCTQSSMFPKETNAVQQRLIVCQSTITFISRIHRMRFRQLCSTPMCCCHHYNVLWLLAMLFPSSQCTIMRFSNSGVFVELQSSGGKVIIWSHTLTSYQRHGVSNHMRLGCLFNILCGLSTMKTANLLIKKPFGRGMRLTQGQYYWLVLSKAQ